MKYNIAWSELRIRHSMWRKTIALAFDLKLEASEVSSPTQPFSTMALFPTLDFFVAKLQGGVAAIIDALEGVDIIHMSFVISELLPYLHHLATFPNFEIFGVTGIAWLAYCKLGYFLELLKGIPMPRSRFSKLVVCTTLIDPMTEIRLILEDLLPMLHIDRKSVV